MALLFLGRNQPALQVYEAMLAEFPGDSYGLASKAHLQAHLGQKRAAQQTFQQLVQVDPANGRHWFNYGFLLEELA